MAPRLFIVCLVLGLGWSAWTAAPGDGEEFIEIDSLAPGEILFNYETIILSGYDQESNVGAESLKCSTTFC